MIATKWLVLILPVLVCAVEEKSIMDMYTRTHGNRNVEELKTKWADLEKKFRMATSKAMGMIMPHVMDSVGNFSLSDVSSACTRDLMTTLIGIKRMEIWAFKMLDAAGKIPSGIINGRSSSLGDYDECLSIQFKDRFKGKYCFMEIVPPLPKVEPYHVGNGTRIRTSQYTVPKSLTGYMIENFEHYLFLFSFGFGICVPSTCTTKDVKNIFTKAVTSFDNEVNVVVSACGTEGDNPFKATFPEIMSVIVLCTSLALVIVGTILDLYMKNSEKNEKRQSVLTEVLLCFSLRINAIKLMKPAPSESIGIFGGMRVASILWVILNHSYLFVVPRAYSSGLFPKRYFSSLPFQVVMNGYFSVETFFFMSAVVLIYTEMKSKASSPGFIPYTLYRAWRLLTPMVFVMALTSLMTYVATGPFAKEGFSFFSDECHRKWWHNVLFLNNYMDGNTGCIPWTWYVAAEMHLYLLAFPVVVTIRKNPFRGRILIAVLMVIGIAALVINHIVYRLPPTVIVSVNWAPDDINYYLHHIYYSSHTHIIAYAVGMAVGFFIYWKPKLRIPKYTNICACTLFIGLGLVLLYSVQPWNREDSPQPGMIVSVLYACASHIIYPCCLAYITISCCSGNCGIINSLLSWKVFTPLSRVTYMAYLIHPLIQFYYTANTKLLMDMNPRPMVYLYLSYVLLSFLVAFVLTLTFEAPFIALQKIVFRSRRTPKIETVTSLSESEQQPNKLNKLQNNCNDELKDTVTKI